MTVTAFVLALAVQGSLPAPAAAAGRDAPSAARQLQSRHKGSGLEARVATLTTALGLDVRQQAELRKVLQGEREQVQRIWNGPAVPAANRIAATRVVSRQTADRIRALLSEEQRKKYEPPPQGDPGEATRGVHVEDWMKVVGKQ